MKPITPPNVRLIETGGTFQVKQMKADKGALLPKHKASLESVLVIVNGACVLRFPDSDHELINGDTCVVPPDVPHQIEVINDLKAFHIMPKAIKFEFFKES